MSDSGHNRGTVVAALDGTVQRIIGGGAEGFSDGPADRASFLTSGRGWLDGDTRCTWPTPNHAIRAVDLTNGTVTTVAVPAGIHGRPCRRFGVADTAEFAVGSRHVGWHALHRNGVRHAPALVARAGWTNREATVQPYAGNGAEALRDGPLAEASMNQPSGLTQARSADADSEASAIRLIVPGTGRPDPERSSVKRIGPAQVRLQHPSASPGTGHGHIADTDTKSARGNPVPRARAIAQLGTGDGAPRRPVRIRVSYRLRRGHQQPRHSRRGSHHGDVRTLTLAGLEPPSV